MVNPWASWTANPWAWVLVGVGIYWLGLIWLRRAGLLPAYVGNQGPFITLHTRRFRELLDRLAGPRRAWRAWGNLGVGIALVVMVGLFYFLARGAYLQLQSPVQPSSVNQPRNVLVIPGVNEFLPLSVAPEIVLGLLVGLVVHEGGHGVMSRVGDIEVESVGLVLVAVLPVGAFVEPDEDSRRAADRGDQTRMFAAGVMNNFAITLVAFALLFGPVVGAIAVAPGAAVYGAFEDSPAANAGIGAGDRVLAVGGRPVGDNAELESTLGAVDGRTVQVRVDGGDGPRTVTVNRSLLVVEATPLPPFSAVDVGERIVAVNGTPVATEPAFRRAVEERRVATVTLANGTTTTGPVGALVVFTEDGPAARDGVPTGPAVITEIDGRRVVSGEALSAALSETRPNQTVSIEVFRDGDRRTHEVELGRHPQGQGQLGVGVARGYSGITVNDFGVQLYPAGAYLDLLGGDPGGSLALQFLLGDRRGLFTGVATAQFLPFIGVFDPTVPYNFPGFTAEVANFYEVPGLPPAFAGPVFGLANVLFWVGWINFNLGIFNCIPAFPLDGGHILRTSTEAVVARLPVRERRELTTAVTTSVGLLMLASLVLMLFGPQLLR